MLYQKLGVSPVAFIEKLTAIFLKGDRNPETNAHLLAKAFQSARIPIDLDRTISGTCVTVDHLREDFSRAREEGAFFAVRINARALDRPHIWGIGSVRDNKVTVVGACEGNKPRQTITPRRLLKRMRKVAERGEENAYIFARRK